MRTTPGSSAARETGTIKKAQKNATPDFISLFFFDPAQRFSMSKSDAEMVSYLDGGRISHDGALRDLVRNAVAPLQHRQRTQTIQSLSAMIQTILESLQRIPKTAP